LRCGDLNYKYIGGLVVVLSLSIIGGGFNLRCWPESKPAQTLPNQIFDRSLKRLFGSRRCDILKVVSELGLANFDGGEDLQVSEGLVVERSEVAGDWLHIASVYGQFVALVKQPFVDFAPFEPSQSNGLFAHLTSDWSIKLLKHFFKGCNLPLGLALASLFKALHVSTPATILLSVLA
jgi:hypothetical protein